MNGLARMLAAAMLRADVASADAAHPGACTLAVEH
jgi:hypothetical protein